MGIPDGMRRYEADAEWKFASMYAKEVTKIMVDKEIIEDDPKVKSAFQAAIEVLNSPMSQGIKLQAARLILDFCKAKPVAKSEITVQKAEDWLMSVTADALKSKED
jgi:3-methyladenine DNA glycosylase Tag